MQDLGTGRGAAWNAGARFPAASTLKLAIAVTALRRLDGPPAPASRVTALLGSMLIVSDNDAANELEAWIGGSVFAGSDRVNDTMRALGLHDSLMYGGYESPRRPAAAPPPIPSASTRNLHSGSASTRRPPTWPGSRAPSTWRRRGKGLC